MFCKYCGQKIDDDSNMCSYCGNIVSEEKAEEKTTEEIKSVEEPKMVEENSNEEPLKTNKKKKLVVPIIAILLVIAIVVAVVFVNKSKRDSSDEPQISTTESTEISTKAQGGETVQVPSILGTDEESAKAVLTNLGLVPVFTDSYSGDYDEDGYEEGTVCGCEPDIGSKIKAGESVTVYISIGKQHQIPVAQNGKFAYSGEFEHIDYLNGSWNINSIEFNNGTLMIDISMNDVSDEWELFSSTTVSIGDISSAIADTDVYNEKTQTSKDESTYTISYSIPLEAYQNNRPTTVKLHQPVQDKDGDKGSWDFTINIQW